MNDFFPERLTEDNCDRYIIRTAIVKALKESTGFLKGRLLDIGCGQMPYKDFIKHNSGVTEYAGLDIANALEYNAAVKPDFTWDGVYMPFEENSYDAAMATEVLEHCPETLTTLKEINRVLKPGAHFFFTVPFLWNLHEVPHDEYRYTPFAMERLLKQAGFSIEYIRATGGWHAAMAQMLGLWIKRSSMSSRNRRLLKKIVLAVMQRLLKASANEKISFKEGQMITGLYGVARK